MKLSIRLLKATAVAAFVSITFAGNALAQVAVTPILPGPIIKPPIIIPPPAPRYDAKVFSGNLCKAYYGRDNASIDSYVHGANNNHATLGKWVSCPIVRDNTTNTNGTWNWWFSRGVQVAVRNAASGSRRLTCNLRSYTSTGGFLESNSGFRLPGTGTINLDLNKSANMGFYSMYCYLPPRSRIISYKVIEYASTDSNN